MKFIETQALHAWWKARMMWKKAFSGMRSAMPTHSESSRSASQTAQKQVGQAWRQA